MKTSKKIVLFAALMMFIISSCGGGKQNEFLFDYIPVKVKKDDKKISLIDYDGNIVVEDEFDYTSVIFPTDDVITETKSDGKVKYWQIVDKKIKPLIDNEYAGGTPFFEDVAVVRDDKGLLSLIDKKGENLIDNLSIVSEYQVTRTGVMSDGLIRFKTSEGLWGYLNIKGEVVIKPTFIQCENFVDGIARVSKSTNTFSIINKKGEEIYKGDDDISYFPVSENLMPFRRKTGDDYFFGLIDITSKEKLIKDSKYQYMKVAYNGFISAANKDLEWGMIDKKGEVIGDLRLKYSFAPIYSKSGVIVAKDNKKVKMFDAKGELIKSFDEYSIIYPVGKNRFLALRDNDKFDILDKEGKEISNESYLLASGIELDWSRDFNIFEQTGITKNFFGIESKYFEFEKTFTTVFKNITVNGIGDVNQNFNIEKVLAKFPYKKNVYSSVTSNSFDNYRIAFDIVGLNPLNSSSSDLASVDTLAVAVDEPYQNSQPASTIVDKYTFLSEYSNSYNTYLNLPNGVNVTYTFNFDQSLKTAVYGKDPIFTDQITIVGYDINRAANLNSLSINYSLGEIDQKIFLENMVKKITAAGWSKDSNSGFYFNAMNKTKLSVNNYSITLYF